MNAYVHREVPNGILIQPFCPPLSTYHHAHLPATSCINISHICMDNTPNINPNPKMLITKHHSYPCSRWREQEKGIPHPSVIDLA